MVARKDTVTLAFEREAKKPLNGELARWMKEELGVSVCDLVSVEHEFGARRVHFKLKDGAKVEELVMEDGGERLFVYEDGSKRKVTLSCAGMGLRYVRVRNLPLEAGEEELKKILSEYGRVLECVREQYGPKSVFPGVLTGVRVARMQLRRHVPNYLRVANCEVYVEYVGQPRTCQRCGSTGHLRAACTRGNTYAARLAAAKGQQTPLFAPAVGFFGETEGQGVSEAEGLGVRGKGGEEQREKSEEIGEEQEEEEEKTGEDEERRGEEGEKREEERERTVVEPEGKDFEENCLIMRKEIEKWSESHSVSAEQTADSKSGADDIVLLSAGSSAGGVSATESLAARSSANTPAAGAAEPVSKKVNCFMNAAGLQDAFEVPLPPTPTAADRTHPLDPAPAPAVTRSSSKRKITARPGPSAPPTTKQKLATDVRKIVKQIQGNASAKKDALQEAAKKSDIVLLQEVAVASFGLRGFAEHVNVGPRGRGTAILVKDHLQSSLLLALPCGRGIAVKVGNTTYISVYAPAGSRGREERAEYFSRDIAPLLAVAGDDLVLAGDFNCVLRGQDTTGTTWRSPELAALVKDLLLVDAWTAVRHDPGHTFFTNTMSARLDRAYVTPRLARQLRGAEVRAVAFSDHAALTISLAQDAGPAPPRRPPRPWSFDARALKDPDFLPDLAEEWQRVVAGRRQDEGVTEWWLRTAKPAVRRVASRVTRQLRGETRSKLTFLNSLLSEQCAAATRTAQLAADIRETKREILAVHAEMLTGVRDRAQLQDALCDEPLSAIHVGQAARRARQQCVDRLEDASGRTLQDPGDIQDEFYNFYQNKFQQVESAESPPARILEVLEKAVGDSLGEAGRKLDRYYILCDPVSTGS
ncbi:Transposon TX1 uncharacterized 149 kDa protein [Frankliniella fusca]|uniref:Transposon TX1 uncharacterized 149 kDa protein n=1 Tax=Frankliniella fusca TaxID=407009 RepID=A0AAE1GTW6_9NEOP|nr:Transposon TX1 uncharacterized 149 kDa protein [Frankliniella fusca]